MKQFLSYMIVALAALWMAGCSDDSLSPADQPERGIVIRLSTGDLETRTDLTSQANLQHVRKVYALLYDGTGTLVDSPELLMDVASQAWDPTEGGSYNDINGEEFVLPQTKTAGLEAGSYTILCVGLDDNSGATYGLTAETMNWKTLAEAKATLAAEKTADDIAHSELFAGWAEFDFEPDNINIVEVEMKRRVAGVLCYVTDIPTTINTGGVNEPVKKLRLALYTGEEPNNRISLCRKEVEKATDGTIKIPDDFGEYSEDAPKLDIENGYLVLKEVDLSEYSSDSDIFSIPEQDTENLKVKANSLLIGAYVIPTKATDGKVTLKVELLGEDDEVLATFNAKRDGTSGSESYNIYPNYIYHIGDKPESDSTEGDQPASLLGKELTVVPQVWTTMPEVDVDFPSVPLVNGIELVNQDYIPYKEGYIFDCIGIDDDNNESYKDTYYLGAPYNERLYVKVTASVLKNKWYLKIIGNEVEEGILYFSQKNADGSYTYSTEYRGDGQADEKVPLLLTSYAKDGGGDTRSVTLQLYHYDEEDNPTVLKAEFKIIQYNALIVDIGDDYGKRGFSRRDWNEGQKIGWGYPNTSVFNIMGTSAYAWYNGNDNLNKAKTRNHDGEFYSSAIYYCARKFVTVTNSQKITSTNWFLPARYELYYFLDAHKSTEGEYWSSSPYGNYRVYINYIKNGEVEYPANINDWIIYTTERTDVYKMRPACEL